jgi:hypothetical protein
MKYKYFVLVLKIITVICYATLIAGIQIINATILEIALPLILDSFSDYSVYHSSGKLSDFFTTTISNIFLDLCIIAPTLCIFFLDRYVYIKLYKFEYKILYYICILVIFMIEIILYVICFNENTIPVKSRYFHIYIAVISPKLIYFLLLYPNRNKIKALLSKAKGLIRGQ